LRLERLIADLTNGIDPLPPRASRALLIPDFQWHPRRIEA
jgi:hypothetical protein